MPNAWIKQKFTTQNMFIWLFSFLFYKKLHIYYHVNQIWYRFFFNKPSNWFNKIFVVMLAFKTKVGTWPHYSFTRLNFLLYYFPIHPNSSCLNFETHIIKLLLHRCKTVSSISIISPSSFHLIKCCHLIYCLVLTV